jgi:hypothetical protein
MYIRFGQATPTPATPKGVWTATQTNCGSRSECFFRDKTTYHCAAPKPVSRDPRKCYCCTKPPAPRADVTAAIAAVGNAITGLSPGLQTMTTPAYNSKDARKVAIQVSTENTAALRIPQQQPTQRRRRRRRGMKKDYIIVGAIILLALGIVLGSSIGKK